MADHPYKHLPERSFWRQSVANKSPFDLQALYVKKFDIGSSDRIAAAGSCFAQHIARKLRAAGYNYLDCDPRPFNMSDEAAAKFGYDLYSARFGNVYTARQLLQLGQRALGGFKPLADSWEQGGRYFDPFRPTIEPDGFESAAEFQAAQKHHLHTVVQMLQQADVFIFTLGLTEAWRDRRDGAVYPVAPGTAAGRFDPQIHEFHNFTHAEILADLRAFIQLARKLKPEMRFIFTVSPVPLVATASDHHVLVATTYSKSVLRAVAGELADTDPGIDYFPSYEVITGQPSRSMFYDPDLRSVNPAGVEVVMKHFFHQHRPLTDAAPNPQTSTFVNEADVVCDEMVLEAGRTGQ